VESNTDLMCCIDNNNSTSKDVNDDDEEEAGAYQSALLKTSIFVFLFCKTV
jgi:hypothetical protein